MVHILFIWLFSAVSVSAGEPDFSEKLEALLTREFVFVLDKTSAGKEITDRIRGDAPKEKGFPSILLKMEDSQRTAWFDYDEWTIYFNSKHAAGFFGIKGYSDGRITRVLALSPAAAGRLSARTRSFRWEARRLKSKITSSRLNAWLLPIRPGSMRDLMKRG